MSPHYIFFDWHKTLSEDIFWPEDNDIADVLFKSKGDLVNRWMKGEKKSEDISKIVQDKIGKDQKYVLEKLEKGCREMSFAIPDIAVHISKIRQLGIGVGIATDNMDTFLRFTAPELKLNGVFDEILVSSETGFLKSEVEGGNIKFFEKFISDKKIKYQDIVLIDDSQKISEIYKPFGLEVITVNNTKDIPKIISDFI